MVQFITRERETRSNKQKKRYGKGSVYDLKKVQDWSG